MSKKNTLKKTKKKSDRDGTSIGSAINDVAWVILLLLVTAGIALLFLEGSGTINLF